MVTVAPAARAAHTRLNTGLLVSLEKRVVVSLAKRVPRWINADHMSALGLTAMAGSGLSFAAFLLTPWAAWGVVLSLALNWLGDCLDGGLARVRGHQRPRYGYYVDHAIDLAGTVFLMAGLAVSGLMSPLTAVIVLAAYLLVSAETYLATHAAGVFRMSLLGVGPTELRILIGIGALRAASDPLVSLGPLGPMRLFDVGGAIAAASLFVIFACSAIRTSRELYLAEPLPRTTGGIAA
jgi:phosphatidylglycerophosphate synthase